MSAVNGPSATGETMSSEFDLDQWDRVARELRAAKESQQRAYGDIDSAILGRYLAGEVGSDELDRVESALAELPELRKLTDLVRDVLGDLEPVVIPAHEAPPAEEPRILTLPRRAPKHRVAAPWWRGRSALVAAACLLLVFTAVVPRGAFLAAPL